MTLKREEISDRLAAVGYVADRDIATALWLMEFLKRPLLLEGEAGVGKTEVGKALAAVYGAELIRLNATRASIRTPRSTNGIISVSSWPSKPAKASAKMPMRLRSIFFPSDIFSNGRCSRPYAAKGARASDR